MKVVDLPIGQILANILYTEDECWVWQKYIDSQGYGRIGVRGKQWKVHRLSYTLFKGEIPSHLVIDHLCRNKACCNPEHLEAVTQRENFMRGERRFMKINPYASK